MYQKSKEFKEEHKIVISEVKVTNMVLVEERDNIVFFLSGIKIYRLDLANKIFKVHGFVVKNDRFKFV